MSDKLYINLVPNPQYTEGSNLPVMVGPANPMHQKEKTGKLELKLGMIGITKQHLIKDEIGGLTIILTPSQSSAKPAGGYQQKAFAAKPSYAKTNTGFKNQF
jgi:hypothetical protein